MKKDERPSILQRVVRATAQNYGVAIILASLIVILVIPWWTLYFGGVIFLASLIASLLDEWRPKARVPVQGKAVFISGCDSGFGHYLAQRLDRLGLQVFAGCLFPENEGTQTLKQSCSEKLHVVPLDVTSDESVQNAAKYVRDNLGNNKFWAVVNNAGIIAGANMAWTSVDTVKRVFEVNTFGVMRTTKAFIPILFKEKGRIVTMSSIAGRYNLPGMLAYCMSKQASISYSEGLRTEAERFGVKVVTIEPWMYKTNITENSNILGTITKCWEEAPEELKKLYPQGYIEKFKRDAAKNLKFSASDKLQEVVDCMEEAVLAQDPKNVYSPGTIYFTVLFWIVKRLPKPIADWLHIKK